MFTSPFAKISKKTEKKLSYSVFYLLVISIIAMRNFDSFLTNATTPNGIVSFELAKTLERSQEILNSWTGTAKIFAGLSIGFDFLFILIYSIFIALLVHKLNERLWRGKPFYRVGELLIWSMFIAAIFDTVENVSLIKLLIGNLKQYWVSIAYYFAIMKFVLIIVSILYIIANFFILLVKKK